MAGRSNDKRGLVPIPGETGSHESSAASTLGSHLRVSPPRCSPLTASGRRQRPPTPSCSSPGPEITLPVWAAKKLHGLAIAAQAGGGVNTVAGPLRPECVRQWRVRATTISVQRPDLQVLIFYSGRETSQSVKLLRVNPCFSNSLVSLPPLPCHTWLRLLL